MIVRLFLQKHLQKYNYLQPPETAYFHYVGLNS